jgi:serine phosphatase RsbU (regulator of sigma subunit)
MSEKSVPPAAADSRHVFRGNRATPAAAMLGAADFEPGFEPVERQLHSGERLVLVTDGVTGRRVEGGGRFGVDGLRRAVAQAPSPTAAATAMAITRAVTDCWSQPLEDDATVVVVAVT